MQNLNINKYDSYNASIKLPGNDLDISDVRLTRLFDSLKIFENVYFIGNRAYFSDDQVDQTIDFLSEEVFIKNTSKSFRLFCRLKPVSFNYNRKLLNKLWQYYEFPAFIFLGDKVDESDLITAYNTSTFHDDLVKNVDNLVILFRLAEQNVIWIKGNVNLSVFF
jgi:hypothetical protein